MLIEEYKTQKVEDIQEALKDLLGGTLEAMQKAELDEHLEYDYGDIPRLRLSKKPLLSHGRRKCKSEFFNFNQEGLTYVNKLLISNLFTVEDISNTFKIDLSKMKFYDNTSPFAYGRELFIVDYFDMKDVPNYLYIHTKDVELEELQSILEKYYLISTRIYMPIRPVNAFNYLKTLFTGINKIMLLIPLSYYIFVYVTNNKSMENRVKKKGIAFVLSESVYYISAIIFIIR